MTRPVSRSRSLLFMTVAVVLSLAAGLVLSECILRLMSPLMVAVFPEGLMRPALDPAVCYEPDPAWPEHDARGLRVTGPATGDGPEGKKMLVIGDSIAYGQGVAPGQTIAADMERVLSSCRPEQGWRVLNLGVPGYGIEQVCARLREKGAGFAPEISVYVFCLNDIVMDAGKVGNFLIANRNNLILPRRSLQNGSLRFLLRFRLTHRIILLYRKLRFRSSYEALERERLLEARKPGDPEAVRLIDHFLSGYRTEDFQGVHWGNASHADYIYYYCMDRYLWRLDFYLGRYAQICKENGIAPWLAIVPLFCREKGRPYVFRDVHRLVQALAERAGIHVVDLQGMEYGGMAAPLAQSDCTHPNELGNEVIARQVLDALGFGECLRR
ncbi:MAG: SGNH/GDSL hydrolase family protein [Thermodesulfobacteriota bacterium]